MQRKRRYLSYLLRLWQESNGDPALWRASLERPADGECLGFASWEDLVSFLERETGSSLSGLERVIQEETRPLSLPEDQEDKSDTPDASEEWPAGSVDAPERG